MISKVMIKFRSKFQFQTPLQFYRIVKKVETYDGNGQKFWQLPPSFQPSHFGYYFVFSWLRFKYTEDSRYFNLANKIFTKKDIVQE